MEANASVVQLGRIDYLRGCNHFFTTDVVVLEMEQNRADLCELQFERGALSSLYEKIDRKWPTRSLLRLNGSHSGSATPGKALTPMEKALLELIVALEERVLVARRYLGEIRFAEIIAGKPEGRLHLVWQTHSKEISCLIASVAFAGLAEIEPSRLIRPPNSSFSSGLDDLERLAKRHRLTPSTALLLYAAETHKIPSQIVNRKHVRLGHGMRQRQIYSSMTGSTSYLAKTIATDKCRTNRYLRRSGLPVSEQIRVNGVAEAKNAIAEVGLPAVIKPIKANLGRGVTAGLRSLDEVPAAFALAEAEGSGVLVERFEHGVEYRLLVIGGRFFAGLKRVAPSVIGDGQRTIRDLIAELNKDPYRDGVRLEQIVVDSAMVQFLSDRDLILESVPAAGQEVAIRSNSNIATGGVSVDVTNLVHPDNKRMAEMAAMAIGLDVAGVDFITPDVERPYHEVGGTIIEINARPGLCMHQWPRFGACRDVAGALLDLTYGNGDRGLIPTVLILGGRSARVAGREFEALLANMGLTAGLNTKEEARVGKMHLSQRSAFGKMTQRLLRNPLLQVYIGAMSAKMVARHGLQVEACDAAAVFPPETTESDPAVRFRSLEALFKANSGPFVIDARGVQSLQGLSNLDRSRIIMTSHRSNCSIVQAHIASGYQAVKLADKAGGSEIQVFEYGTPVWSIPLAVALRGRGTSDKLAIRGTIISIALAYALGFERTKISAAFHSEVMKTRER